MWIQRCREDKMYRTQCVLALLALCAGSAHSFSWDVVIGTKTLQFYNNEGTLTYSGTTTYTNIFWLTYDPFNNRVLFIDDDHKNEVYSFDITTKKTQSLVKINKLELRTATFAYDPATGLLFGIKSDKMYSFLTKSGPNNEIDGNLVIDLQKEADIVYVAVDSCGGYIYWIWSSSDYSNMIERVRFNGADREVIIDKSKTNRACLAIDSQAQKIYWVESRRILKDFIIVSADMNGKNKRTLYFEDVTASGYNPGGFTVSKDFIYWGNWNKNIFWQLPQNLPRDTDVKSKQMEISDSNFGIYAIAAKYEIEEQTLGIPLCKALKCLLPNNSATNDCDSLNVPADVNPLCVHGTKVSGESSFESAQGYSSERCDVSVCHNYCLHGDCSASAEGQPKCRCNAGYSGERCEVDPCQGYCLNNGDCSLNDESYPVCKCSGGYDGERCHHPVFLGKPYEKFECWRTF